MSSRLQRNADVDAATWQCASVLMDYPGEEQHDRLGVVRAAVLAHPELADRFGAFLAWLDRTEPAAAQAAYVETFDNRRKCNLFLTYFAHGDTRKRGVALLRFKQTYLAAGVVPDDAELPDHLSVVLEFAATVDARSGLGLLLDHRAGLEVLRLSLRELGSPWADVVEAVCATLPALRGDEWEAVRKLAAEGPPEEEVGLTPYGTPGFDAALVDRPVDLPMPTFSGRGA
jgi:nitrate reductase delta subunit